MKYENKKVLICGMGLSGVAAARLLLKYGARITLQDAKETPNCPEDLSAHPQVTAYFGASPDEIIGEFDIIVLSPGIPTDTPFVVKAQELGIPIIGEIELAASLCAAPIIAITGTNGKTTTTAMVGDIMRLFAPASQVAGNIGIPFCSLAETMPPDAFVAAEVSSFQLETITAFKPKISAVLNMTEDHLNRHKTMEAYVAAKERIFENQDARDFCILNYDNEYTRLMADKTAARVVFFSKSPLDEGVFVKGDAIYVKFNGTNSEIIKTADLPIPGAHNVENAMAAIAMAYAAGVPIDIISQGLRGFKAVEHRLEFVRTIHDIHFYNDSKATNTDAAIKGLDAMSRPTILIGGGQNKGLDFSEWVGMFADKVKIFIAIGETAEMLAKTCLAHGFKNVHMAADMQKAVSLAASLAAPGDCVLLSPACASYDMFDSYEHRGMVFKKHVWEL